MSRSPASHCWSPSHRSTRARAALEGQLLRTGTACGISVAENVAVVALVGSGMHGTPGVAARLFGAIAKRNINVVAIAPGSSELSVCFVVDAAAVAEAVRALHEEFKLAE